MNEEYLTTDEAVKAMMSGKKLEGYTIDDYFYYDNSYALPFRYVNEFSNNTMITVFMWEEKQNKWKIFKKPEYEYQWLYLNNSNSYETTTYLTDYEFSITIRKLYSCYEKIERSKRLRK